MKANESHTGISRTAKGIFVFFTLTSVAIAYAAVSSLSKTNRPTTQPISDVQETGDQSVDHDTRSSAGNRHLETKLALLNARQSNLEDDINRIEDQMTAVSSTDESGLDNELSQEERSKQAEQKYMDQVELLDKTLSEEQRDPAWSQNANDEIYKTMMETGLVKSVKPLCQSTFCKFDMEFVNQAETFQIMSVLNRSLPWGGQAFVKADSSTGVGTIYLARQGFELPKI